MTIPVEAYAKIASDAQAGRIEGQTKAPPSYWIETTQGMSGYFAVMVWDGMGFPEPWETGIGRYKTKSEAVKEARQWAEDEGLEFRS